MGVGKDGNFANLVADGENPNGVRTEGAFGVSHGGLGEDYYQQVSYSVNIAGDRWGGGSAGWLPPTSPSWPPAMEPPARELKGQALKGGR